VRDFAVAQQQAMGEYKGIVMDGRDIGTVVFPTAELKIFVTADPAIRVERRFLELQITNPTIRKEEIDADDFAVRLCKALGYNKAGLFKFMHSKKENYAYYNLLASQPNSTHPSYDQRIKRAKKQGFQLSKGGVQQMNTLMTHLA
jgi:hypothetical protein